MGIIIGSNIFNLTALLGLCALIAGRLPLKKQAMIFNGVISLIVTLVLVLLVFGFISAPLSVVILALVLVPYAIVSGLKPSQMKRWRLPVTIRNFVTEANASTRHVSAGRKAAMPKSWSWAWTGGAALIVIIVTCMGMVRSAIVLSDAWGLNKTVLGVLVFDERIHQNERSAWRWLVCGVCECRDRLEGVVNHGSLGTTPGDAVVAYELK